MMRRICLPLAVVVCAACGPDQTARLGETFDTSAEAAQALTELTNFGSNPGNLKMFVTTPSSPQPKPGLVVAMHGCTQTAAAYQAAGWDTYAERYGFYVLYPQTSGGISCFAWYDLANITRGKGQAESISQAVESLKSTYHIDPKKVFVTGLSAGGAMTSAMLGSYPDVYAAGTIMAGIPYQCTTSINNATQCQQGTDKTPEQWAALVTQANPNYQGPWPRVAVWNGSSDSTVNPKNLTEIVDQWTQVNGIDQTADEVTTVGKATRSEYRDSSGKTLVESWLVNGMGHGTAVDPTHGCGKAGAFMLDVGLCSTEWSTKFFGLDIAAPDTDHDAGSIDAGHDAGSIDAGHDAGSIDAGHDAGSIDAGHDAGSIDAGHDAGSIDAGHDAGSIDAGPIDAGVCSEVNATNYAHTSAGRATVCSYFYACAKGSGERLGPWNAFNTSWVHTTDGSYWSAGQCP